MSTSRNSTSIVPALLTTAEAAGLCHVGERTFWRLSRSGVAPRPIKLGHTKKALVRYSRAAILEWIEGGCQPVGN